MKMDAIEIHQRDRVTASSRSRASTTASEKPAATRRDWRLGFTFSVCMVTWLVLSGKFDAFHITLGVISSLIVAFLSADLLISRSEFRGLPTTGWRLIKFTPWLLVQVFAANLHVMRLVFHPRMHQLISPRIIRFRSRLQSDMARFVLANAITLTPGTITVFASIMGNYTVHVIDAKSEAGVPGEMEARIAAIYGE